MKQYKFRLFYSVLSCLVLTGCDKYLDIEPKGQTLLTTVAHYDQWLNDPSLSNGFAPTYCTMNYMADNYDYVKITTPPTTPAELIYTWGAQFQSDLSAAPFYWGEHYSKINQFNTVLLGIDDATGGTNSQKRSLKGEALLGRAFEYWYLVNEYGKQYDSTTAAKDLAVPFVTSNDVAQVVPPRSTVAEIYTHIIDDINSAIPDLPDDNSGNRLRSSKAAAYSVLARVYFYAGNYKDAEKYAQMALDNSKTVMYDLNGALPSTNLISTWTDVIYGRTEPVLSTVTLEFMRTFAFNDLRVKKLYYSTDGYTFTVRGATQFAPGYIAAVIQNLNTGTSMQEMKLIVAECAARRNDLAIALKQLDDIRKKRFAAASYVKYESNNQESVLQEVLLEKQHELPCIGLRWFDMRRLDKENRMGTVFRYDAQGNVIAKLPPHSERYTLQIPLQVISYNPGMPQNP